MISGTVIGLGVHNIDTFNWRITNCCTLTHKPISGATGTSASTGRVGASGLSKAPKNGWKAKLFETQLEIQQKGEALLPQGSSPCLLTASIASSCLKIAVVETCTITRSLHVQAAPGRCHLSTIGTPGRYSSSFVGKC